MAHPKILGEWLWHDLMTTDPSAATEFYRKVVGWPSQPWDRDPSYTFLLGPQGPVAGLMGMPPDVPAGTPPFWSLYIGTPDLDGSIAAAQRLGAKLCNEASEIPTIGRFAVLTDPQGAAFTLFTPLDDSAPSNAPPRVGDFSWHELATTDFEAAFRFYSELFGWKEMERMDMGPNGIYFIFGWGAAQRGGMYNHAPAMQGPPNWLSYASVANTDASVTRARAAGGRVINGPMDVPGEGRVAIMMDPQGAVFAVHSQKEAPASKAQAAPSKTQPAKKKGKPTARKARTGGKQKPPARAKAKKRRTVAKKAVARPTRKTRKPAKARRPSKRRRTRTARPK